MTRMNAETQSREIIEEAYVSQKGWPVHITIPKDVISRIADRISKAGTNAVAYYPLEILTLSYFKYRKQALAPLDIPESIEVYIHAERQDIIGGGKGDSMFDIPMWSSPRQRVTMETNQEIIILDIERLEPLGLSPSTFMIQEAKSVNAIG